MILRKITYLLLALLVFTGCRQKVVEIEVIVPLPSKVKFSVEVNDFSVRNEATTGLLPEESRIFNYAVLIFDASERLEAFLTASPYSPNIPGSEGIDYDGSLVFTDEDGEEIELHITAGKKYVYALINAPRPILEWRDKMLDAEGTTLEEFKNWVFDAGENGGLDIITGRTAVPTGDERGFMMTTKEGVQVIYLDPTEEEQDEPITIEIHAGRAMAKASFSSSLSKPRKTEEQPYGTLTDIIYKVINNPSEMYLIPNYLNGVLITPYYYSPADEENNRLYFDSPGTLEDNYVPVSTPDNLTYVYCMENANQSPDVNNATMILIKGIFTPDILYLADGQTVYTDYKTGDTFWRVIELENGIRGDYQEKYYGQDPSPRLEEGYAAIAYPGGETIYPVLLYNSENQLAPYTVMRNSYYHVELTKVNGAGNSTDDKIISPPSKPSEEVPIEVNIQIMEWQEIQQSGNI